MPNEPISNESNLKYDDRRKVLLQKKKQVSVNKTNDEDKKVLSNVSQTLEVEYSEEGIRMAYKNLSETRTGLEQRIKSLKKKIEEVPELTEEEQKLKEQIDHITKHVNAEKVKEDLEKSEEDLKAVKKDIQEIKDAIGDRLKL